MWEFARKGPGCSSRLLAAAVLVAVLAAARADEVKEFVAVNVLPDGEVETRVFYGGVCAKEVTVGKGSSSDIKFRQLADASRLIQLIYNDGEDLKDCEIIHQRDQVRKFLHSFKSDLGNLIATSNVTVESLDSKKLPEEFSSWFNFTQLVNQCKRLHHQMKQEVLEMKTHQTDRSKRAIFVAPGTLWCGDSNNAKHYTQLGVLANTDKCCRRHDHCKMIIPGFSTKFHYTNLSPFTLSHCHCDERQKRDVSDLLRVPGTKWCGKGYSADKYTRLGGFSRTDKCCRRHDLSCRFWIGAFETKWGLFNWRINTIMHCSCDERSVEGCCMLSGDRGVVRVTRARSVSFFGQILLYL
ncbi:hypothetical protein Zmor_022815 [Zophobas morio]|uniref:phospholipase A2 n=1 Tax=Zophobas morio TaxID=2755281 RepID=A0AA38M6R1_9CUCU|nr:hypothetical protein Zmor_022815 [Zophobas morio]